MTVDTSPEALDALEKRLRRADEYEPLGHDGWEAAEVIAALEARVETLLVERDNAQSISAMRYRELMELDAKATAAIDALRAALMEMRKRAAQVVLPTGDTTWNGSWLEPILRSIRDRILALPLDAPAHEG